MVARAIHVRLEHSKQEKMPINPPKPAVNLPPRPTKAPAVLASLFTIPTTNGELYTHYGDGCRIKLNPKLDAPMEILEPESDFSAPSNFVSKHSNNIPPADGKHYVWRNGCLRALD